MRSIVDGFPASSYEDYDSENSCVVTPEPKAPKEKKNKEPASKFSFWAIVLALVGIATLIFIATRP